MWVGCFHCETCTWWLSLLSAVAAPQSCSGRTASAARSASMGPQWRRQEREAPPRLLRGLRASSTESWPNPGGRAARISPTSTILPPIPVPWTPPSSLTRPEFTPPVPPPLHVTQESQGSGPGRWEALFHLLESEASFRGRWSHLSIENLPVSPDCPTSASAGPLRRGEATVTVRDAHWGFRKRSGHRSSFIALLKLYSHFVFVSLHKFDV